MSKVITGIIITSMLLAVGAFFFFPAKTFNAVVVPILDATMEKNAPETETNTPQHTLREPPPNAEEIKPRVVPTQSIKIEASMPLLPPPAQLNGSDAKLLSTAHKINPKFTEWLTPAEQIRKWTAFVDHLAQKKLLTKYRPLVFKPSPFKVISKNGKLYSSPENSQRYNALIEAITFVEPNLLARYYHYWLPIFDQAYAELGNSSHFDERLKRAIDTILSVTPLDTEHAALETPTSVTYKYINTDIETSSAITKWVWRIGPDNAKKLQGYLRNFLAQLEN